MISARPCSALNRSHCRISPIASRLSCLARALLGRLSQPCYSSFRPTITPFSWFPLGRVHFRRSSRLALRLFDSKDFLVPDGTLFDLPGLAVLLTIFPRPSRELCFLRKWVRVRALTSPHINTPARIDSAERIDRSTFSNHDVTSDLHAPQLGMSLSYIKLHPRRRLLPQPYHRHVQPRPRPSYLQNNQHRDHSSPENRGFPQVDQQC